MFRERAIQLIGVGVAAELRAVQASEEVCARRPVAIERGEELISGSAFKPGRVTDRINCARTGGT